MIGLKKTITVGFAATLLLTTSATTFAWHSRSDTSLPGGYSELLEVDFEDYYAAETADDEEFETAAVDTDEDDIDDEGDADDESEDDDIAEEDDSEDDVADADDVDGEEAAEEDADDSDEDDEDVVEDDTDEEDVDVVEDETDEIDEDVAESGLFEVVVKVDCDTGYCGALTLRDADSEEITVTDVRFADTLLATASPEELTFAKTHSGCHVRGYFVSSGEVDGVEGYSFYVEEFV